MSRRRLSRAYLLALALAWAPILRAEVVAKAEGESDIKPLPEEPPVPARPPTRDRLVEEFTAETLERGEWKIGTELEAGITPSLMLGTDLITSLMGAPTVQGKMTLWDRPNHKLALGLRAAFLSRETLLWGGVREHYDRLDANMIRPQISLSQILSSRLKIHTFWSRGLGSIKVKLSERGRRHLWEAKHPGEHYDTRQPVTQAPGPDDPSVTPSSSSSSPESGHSSRDDPDNREKNASERASPAARTLQVQSIAGLAQERIQITGEFTRQSGHKVLITSRIEWMELEQLRSNAFRLTLAHHWIWSSLQVRLGFGAQYYSLSGRDLDGEILDDSGLAPASDLAFYWRL